MDIAAGIERFPLLCSGKMTITGRRLDENKCVRPALLSQPAGDNIRCNVCERRCLLAPGMTGWCRTRENRGGVLITRVYGAVSSVESGPIEDKAFYHFNPGTTALSAGSWSCNLECPWCENWEISRMTPPRDSRFVSPERFVNWTEAAGCQGIALSFNEPTLSLEWALDLFRLARRRGLYNVYITNGLMTPEALDLLIDAGLEAMSVDVKAGDSVIESCRLPEPDKVWTICQRARDRGLHLELSTLVIPGVNDREPILADTAARIRNELGADVPWHLIGYTPAYKFMAPPTPIRTLERAWQSGRRAGLEFVYIEKVPGHRFANTHCPACSTLLIRRLGSEILSNSIRHGRCPACGHSIPGVWPLAPSQPEETR